MRRTQKPSKLGKEAACEAHPNPPFGYEGLKANPGFLVITFGALQSFLEAGATIDDYIAAQKTPVIGGCQKPAPNLPQPTLADQTTQANES